MSLIKCCYKNILESGTVTLDAGTEDSDYPLYRVYDRDIGKLFKLSSAVTMEVLVDQGASGNIAIDQLLIPAGHNLDGMTLDWKYSDDDAAYYNMVSQWVQSGTALIDKSASSVTHRYWKFIITSPASIPQIPEIFMSPSYTWEQNPAEEWGPFDKVFNVENLMTAGGNDRFLIHGDPREQRPYVTNMVEDTQKDNILALNDAWQGAKPFYVRDHDGTWIYGKLIDAISMRQIREHDTGGYYSFNFPFQEVLA